MKAVCILHGGKDYVILVRGIRWRFEDHPFCGPMPATQPTKAFWEAVTKWYATGKRVVDGVCVYD